MIEQEIRVDVRDETYMACRRGWGRKQCIEYNVNNGAYIILVQLREVYASCPDNNIETQVTVVQVSHSTNTR